MFPTAPPRDSCRARCAARGIRICTVAELKPIRNEIARNAPAWPLRQQRRDGRWKRPRSSLPACGFRAGRQDARRDQLGDRLRVVKIGGNHATAECKEGDQAPRGFVCAWTTRPGEVSDVMIRSAKVNAHRPRRPQACDGSEVSIFPGGVGSTTGSTIDGDVVGESRAISGHYCAWYRSGEQRRGDATRHRTHYRAKKDPCQRSKDGVDDALLVQIRADLKTTTAVAPLRLDYLPASSLEMVPSSLRACFRIKPSFLRAGSSVTE
ncbi:hypothetical protein P3T40_006828 [Paraburkholderia sp. EB58]